MNKYTNFFLGAVALVTFSVAPFVSAQAEDGRNGAAALGVLGGIAAGAAIAGAANNNNPVYIGRPQAIEEDDDTVVCHYERRRVETPEGIRIRHIRVCE